VKKLSELLSEARSEIIGGLVVAAILAIITFGASFD
jgi:hypothetical protein